MSHRLASGGVAIDRSRPIAFTFAGVAYRGFAGDTLASALLANDAADAWRSLYAGRPRGIVGAGREEPGALVQVRRGGVSEPMLRATEVPLTEGLEAEPLAGRGRLAVDGGARRGHHMHAHCDVLVVGAGAAGRAAVDAALADGARVILVSDEPVSGAGTAPDLRVLERATAAGLYDAGYAVVVEQGERQRLWHIRARRVVLATGATERPIAFAGNDRPGVMLASAARRYVERYAVAPGRRAVVFTTNDSALAPIDGIEIVEVVDARDGRLVVGTTGEAHVDGVDLDDGRHIAADLLLVSGGWNPSLDLLCHAGGKLRWDAERAAFVADTHPAWIEVAEDHVPDDRPPVALWRVPHGDPACQFVDLQRDVTVADLLRATGAGLRSPEHVKRFTTLGTGADQGRTSGVLGLGVLADATGVALADLSPTTFRPPTTPISFALLAGRDRGALHDPVRTTPIHPWHVAAGAVFEDVGQWKRPWYYPREGEDLDAAVRRECRAVREAVGAMDATTLGKIDVHGPDATAFLNRMYTGDVSTLEVGLAKYGILCDATGMVFDDGVVLRLAEDRYLVTTTTGNAAAVLDWFEEWLQTEWPDLRVHCTSVTEQWATVAIAGPRSRDVIGALAPDLPVDNAALPFMAVRDAVVAGIEARVARISFSGELAFEVSVAGWHGLALWEAVMAAGAPHAITPYGTETMHVLRAEKGYFIVGQDTDGTVTPQDLGYGWAVSQRKGDFVGRRSHRRADARRPDRKQLVALLTEDARTRVAEGAQVVDDPDAPVPVAMLGHVTSSYDSVALGRPFALALVRGGRARVGQAVHLTHDGGWVTARIHEPVLYDPEGARRDG
jgi:sarcosine oxidase subunit alpha